MTIALEFIDFIVPIAVIKKKYPGGWDQCLKDHENLIGGRVWFGRAPATGWGDESGGHRIAHPRVDGIGL